jgi:hypothetical protein
VTFDFECVPIKILRSHLMLEFFPMKGEVNCGRKR